MGLYYPCSENKGADQLRGYREDDLCLCFRICKKPVFSRRGSYGDMVKTGFLDMTRFGKHLPGPLPQGIAQCPQE